MLDIRRLRAILAISETGSFSAAAEKIHVAQPALSSQIKELESHLGLPLFKRHARGVTPTYSGRLLVEHARRILDALEMAEKDLIDRHKEMRFRVRLGLPYSVAVILVQPLFSKITTEYPNIELHLEEHFSGSLVERLAERRLDLAIVVGEPREPRITCQNLVKEKMFFVHPRKFDNGNENIELSKVLEMPLILPSVPSGVRVLMESHAVVQGQRLNLLHEVDSAHQLISLVEAGLGGTVLSKTSILPNLEKETLYAKPIIEPTVWRNLVIGWATNNMQEPHVQIVYNVILDLLKGLNNDDTWPAVWLHD